MKGTLVFTNEMWFVLTFDGRRYCVHGDDYFMSLTKNEAVEFELDALNLARIIRSESVHQTCVNSLKLFFKINHRVLETALDFVSMKVCRDAGVKYLRDAAGELIKNASGEAYLYIPR